MANNNLTTKQERYVQELIKGKSQRESYKIAYPKSNNWKDGSVDRAASDLYNNSKVNSRYEELLEKHQQKAIITRGELLEGLKMAFEIATGTRPNQVEVEDVLNGNVIIENKKVKSTDLKSITGIAHQIAKLEGWEIDKVEHSGQIKQEIDYSKMDTKQLIAECKAEGMSDEEIVKLMEE